MGDKMSISNQDLWKILSGHSSLREPKLLETEVCSCAERLRKGLAYYQPRRPTNGCLKSPPSGQAKEKHHQFVLLMSSQFNLQMEQSRDLFKSFISSAYRGSLSQLHSRLTTHKQQQDLLEEVRGHYYSERLTLLHCLKHLLGYWQDMEHPYQEVYKRCLEKIYSTGDNLITGVWEQYANCVGAQIPSGLQGQYGEQRWVVQNLREQCELLEIVLLFYKDYSHPPRTLCETVKLFDSHEFGSRQQHLENRACLVPDAKSLITHLNHLSSLILLEAVDLDYICQYQSDPNRLQQHHLVVHSTGNDVKEVKNEINKWKEKIRSQGDMICCTPFLLAWMVVSHCTQPDSIDTELGNKALKSGVFDYILSILDSSYLSRETPVSGVCKVVIYSLLSLCLSNFCEDSLGDVATLVAIANKVLTHPRLKLEFWKKSVKEGVGVLLPSAMAFFPMSLSHSLPLLITLSAHPLTAMSVTRCLCNTSSFCERVSAQTNIAGMGAQNRHLYKQESRQLGVPPLVIPAGTNWRLLPVNAEGQSLVVWEFEYSALDVCMFEICSLLHSPGIGIDTTVHPLVTMGTQITKLVTEVLSNDWSTFEYYHPITSQYYGLIQKLSPLPNPPAQLIAACLQCLATESRNNLPEAWEKLTRTGFLPHINGSYSSLDRVQVSSGHFGHVLNTLECSRGVYLVTMAMTELILSTFESNITMETNSLLASVVYLMQNVFSSCHKWRYQTSSGRSELANKLLKLCHSILKRENHFDTARSVACEFLTHFLLYSHGHQTLLGTLSLGVEAVNRLLKNQYSSPHLPVQVDSLKVVFEIIDLLLQAKSHEEPSALESALATQSIKQTTDTPSDGRGFRHVHLVYLIASYIHHHDDPHVPVGATKLLTRLSLVAPMSVFACLGHEATPIRDAYITRLKSYVEDTQLKISIFQLVLASVHSQPGMAELFLSARPNKSPEKGQPVYTLDEESCLHSVLDIIKLESHCQSPSLLLAATSLLHGLWEARHDAALVALRGEKDFWKGITKPLLDRGDKCDLLVASHVMNIIAMETYYTVKQQMDRDLLCVLESLAANDCYCHWIRCLKFSTDALLKTQLDLSEALSSLLLVVSASPDTEVRHLDRARRMRTLREILISIESQLARPNNPVAIATNLSMLYLVLNRKWSCDFDQAFYNSCLVSVSHILQLSKKISAITCSELQSNLYSILVSLYQTARKSNAGVEPRFTLSLVPIIAETLQYNHTYIVQGSKFRPDITAVYVLNEILDTLSTDVWLPSLHHHSLLTVIVRAADEHIQHQSDQKFVEAILTLFLTVTNSRQGSESLLLNGLASLLCTSMPEVVSMIPGKPVSDSQWRGVWSMVLRIVNGMLIALDHQFLKHALDFVGVYEERLAVALDVFYAIKDLTSLKETVCVCKFFLTLSRFKAQWQFPSPSLYLSLLERVVLLSGSLTALLNKRSDLKSVIKTMSAAGVLPPDLGPTVIAIATGTPRKTVRGIGDCPDDSLITSCPAFTQLQNGLLSALTSVMCSLRYFTPDLDAMILDGVLDLAAFPPLFSLSLDPPTEDNATPPSLGTLTTCLSTSLALLNRADSSKVGSPSKFSVTGVSPSPSCSRVSAERKVELLYLMEQTVFLLLSQAVRYLVDPTVDSHEKQLLRKELANELGSFLNSLLLICSRRGAPAPSSIRSATPSRSHTLFQTLNDSSSSGKVSSLLFSDDQGLFKMADSFVKHFFR